jgi:hypothetical protein
MKVARDRCKLSSDVYDGLHAPTLSVPMPGWQSGFSVSAVAVCYSVDSIVLDAQQCGDRGRLTCVVAERSSGRADFSQSAGGHDHRRISANCSTPAII